MNKKAPTVFKVVLFNFIFLGMLLLITEGVFRVKGYQPGVIGNSQWFTEVDTLKQKQGFFADETGIFRVDTSFFRPISSLIRALNDDGCLGHSVEFCDDKTWEVVGLVKDMIEIHEGKEKNEFYQFITSIKQKQELTPHEKAFLDFSFNGLNQDGFRSIAFDSSLHLPKKVLLLGDSFTWGHSTSNKTNAFSDILGARGFSVYNTGISGADPVQYLEVAKKYIPLLQPEVVVVNFYMGNDIMHAHRAIRPYTPIYYLTNAGNLYSCPAGIYFESPQETYDYVLALQKLQPYNWIDKICASSVIGTQLWLILRKAGLVTYILPQYSDYTHRMRALHHKTPVSEEYIIQIKELCDSLEIPFLLSVIPTMEHLHEAPNEVAPGLFQTLNYFTCEVPLAHYHSDGHFNDVGHKIYADCLESYLNDIFSNRDQSDQKTE